MTTDQKVKYIKYYIHFRKGLMVPIRPPKDEREKALLDQMYVNAENYMISIGKEIRI